VTGNITVQAIFVVGVAVKETDKLVPGQADVTAVLTPVRPVPAALTAGPNPRARQAGRIDLFWSGNVFGDATLTVFDAAGNAVRKLVISDNAAIGSASRRTVGSWDLKDAMGRAVANGTYLVKGTIVTADGKKEMVSLKVGIR
ncbi:MAG: hypothetical protein FWB85_08620, partial [Chitinispirillia bacterium]|nr:hypothetical protein [Chitinispirillia bacterium]MCL2242240.1 hypothetical protein [Chitinispirillia bacterium]